MAKKKFKAKPFKDWLDHLAAVVVKTRDDFTCQIGHTPYDKRSNGCAGTMSPGDFNCQCCHIESRNENKTRWDLLNLVTGCGNCHAWAHAHPARFGVWFIQRFPHRDAHINEMLFQPNKTWRQADFEEVEIFLLRKARDLNVDCITVNTRYRVKFRRKIESLEGD